LRASSTRLERRASDDLQQLRANAVALVHRQRPPVAGYELGAVRGGGGSYQRIVCGPAADLQTGEIEHERAGSGRAQTQPGLREARGQEFSDDVALDAVGAGSRVRTE
jgi:hypothetical protein